MTERIDSNNVPCGTRNGNDLALGLAGHLPRLLTTYPDILLVKEGAMYTYGLPDLPLKPFLNSKDAIHPLAVLYGNYDKLSTARQRMEKMSNEMRFSPSVPASVKLQHEMKELLGRQKEMKLEPLMVNNRIHYLWNLDEKETMATYSEKFIENLAVALYPCIEMTAFIREFLREVGTAFKVIKRTTQMFHKIWLPKLVGPRKPYLYLHEQMGSPEWATVSRKREIQTAPQRFKNIPGEINLSALKKNVRDNSQKIALESRAESAQGVEESGASCPEEQRT